MFGLLRKYQKSLFVIVAFFMISSLVFFGAFSALAEFKKEPNRVVGRMLDGRKIREKEYAALVRFLSSDRQDVEMWQKGSMPNWLNDGVIRNDIVATGLAQKIAERHIEELTEDLDALLVKARHYRSYVHPQAPFISAEAVWNQFMPGLAKDLQAIKNPDLKPNLEAFSLLTSLYIDQSEFPSTILRQLIGFQEKQNSWVPHDNALERLDLSLLNSHNLGEWFGPRFVELCAQVVLNGAALAEKRGYAVTYQEARTQLLRGGLEVIQAETGKKEVTPEELSRFLTHQLATLQMDERTAVESWRQIMLFRTLLSDASHASFLDPLLYEDFLSYAHDSLKVEHYHLPHELKMRDMLDIAQLQLYWQQLGHRLDEIMPPLGNDLQTKRPELLQNRYQVEVAQVSLAQLARTIAIKEMWAWQTEEQNWHQLMQKFPQLTTQIARTAEERFALLETCDDLLRDQIDEASRSMMVLSSPNMIKEALLSESFKEREIWVTLAGLTNLFGGATKASDLNSTLDRISQDEIEIYSPDKKQFFALRNCKKIAESETLLYSQARSRGILRDLLDQELAAQYPKIRASEPAQFKDEKGDYLPYEQVKVQVARLHYKNLLSRLDKTLAERGIKVEGESPNELDQFYARYRFVPYLESIRSAVLRGESPSALNIASTSLAYEWRVAAEMAHQLRKNPDSWLGDNAFEMEEGSWSEVYADGSGLPSFFQVLAHEKSEPDRAKEMQKGQELIAREAQQFIFDELLDEMDDGQAYVDMPMRDDGVR